MRDRATNEVMELSNKIKKLYKQMQKLEVSNHFISFLYNFLFYVKNFHESNLLSLSINKASKELGWKPTLNFENTIDFTASWYKAYINGENLEKMTANQIKFYTSKMRIKK